MRRKYRTDFVGVLLLVNRTGMPSNVKHLYVCTSVQKARNTRFQIYTKNKVDGKMYLRNQRTNSLHTNCGDIKFQLTITLC